jgi:hypothetical protein
MAVDANSDQDMTIVHSSLPKMRTKAYTFSTTHHLCSLPPVQMPALKLSAKKAHQKSRLSLQGTLKCLDSLATLSLYTFCLDFCHTFSMLLPRLFALFVTLLVHSPKACPKVVYRKCEPKRTLSLQCTLSFLAVRATLSTFRRHVHHKAQVLVNRP